MIVIKIILFPVLVMLYLLARCFQFFLKICSAVVTFVCIVAASVLTLAVLVQIILQMQGRGPGVVPIFLSALLAGALAYVPAAGVGVVMVVLEGICIWIGRFYGSVLKEKKIFQRKEGYKWADYDWDNKSHSSGRKENQGNDEERKIHYFRGIHTVEDLKRRYYALLKIYHPDNEFGEDEITRSIMDEYDYLKNQLPEEDES